MSLPTVTLTLCLAEREDFVRRDNPEKMRIGAMYFLKSLVTGKIDPIPLYTSEEMDRQQFRFHFENNQVFVARQLLGDIEIREQERRLEEAKHFAMPPDVSPQNTIPTPP